MTQNKAKTILSNLNAPVQREGTKVVRSKQGYQRVPRTYRERNPFTPTVLKPTKARRVVILRASLNDWR
jgi:hypothetical protein